MTTELSRHELIFALSDVLPDPNRGGTRVLSSRRVVLTPGTTMGTSGPYVTLGMFLSVGYEDGQWLVPCETRSQETIGGSFV